MKGGVLEVEKYGDWVKASFLWSDLSRNRALLRDAAKGARNFGERYKKYLIYGVLTNGAYVGEVWPPVSSKYGRWKERTKNVSRDNLLVYSGNYLRQLKGIKITQKSYMVDMGFSRGALSSKGHRKGLPLSRYSKILEYGSASRNIPPRPLWAPAFDKLRGYKGLVNSMKSAIGRRLRKHGINFFR